MKVTELIYQYFNMSKNLFSTIILSTYLLTSISAQEAIVPTGGDASGTGGSASFSIGQVAYKTTSGPEGSEAQGVQQPFEISVFTALTEPDFEISLSISPNPVLDFLSLRVDDFEKEKLVYQLFDLNGKLLESGKITDNLTQIPTSRLISATYFLKIKASGADLKTFKIIKN